MKKNIRKKGKGKMHENLVERALRKIIYNEYGKMNHMIQAMERQTRRVNDLASTIEINNAKAYAMVDFDRVLTPDSSSIDISGKGNKKYNTPNFLNDKDKRLYNAIKTRIKIANETIKIEENKIFNLMDKNEQEKSIFIDIFDTANDGEYMPVESYSPYQTKESVVHFLDFKEGLGLYKNINDNKKKQKLKANNNTKMMKNKNTTKMTTNNDSNNENTKKYYNILLYGSHKDEMKLQKLLHNHMGSSMWNNNFKNFETTMENYRQKTRNDSNTLDELLFQIYSKRCETTSNIFTKWINDVIEELNLTFHGNKNETDASNTLLKLLFFATKVLNNEINDMKYKLSMYRSSANEKEMMFIPRS